MPRHAFSFRRFWSIAVKEFIQMRRDRVTFAMMVGIPLLQLILFGYAINMNPKHLPTAVFSADHSVFSRTLVWALRNSEYYEIVREATSEAEIETLLWTTEVAAGDVNLVLQKGSVGENPTLRYRVHRISVA